MTYLDFIVSFIGWDKYFVMCYDTIEASTGHYKFSFINMNRKIQDKRIPRACTQITIMMGHTVETKMWTIKWKMRCNNISQNIVYNDDIHWIWKIYIAAILSRWYILLRICVLPDKYYSHHSRLQIYFPIFFIWPL